jgi:hypothetical protein
MSSSLFALMARMSRFCSFVSFLIGSPFVRFGGASRNNANDLFIFFLTKCVYDQQNRARPDSSNCYPAFFILECQVALGDGIGIVEDKRRGLKADIMLAKVPPVLVLRPFKSHSRSLQKQDRDLDQMCQYMCTYNIASF